MKYLQKIHWGIVAGLVLMVFATVSAATSYTVRVDNVDLTAFPGVALDLAITGDAAGLLPNNLEILENGTETRGALVLLPPAPAATKIDLLILLDEDGLKGNAEVVDRKLDALAKYVEEAGLDVKIVYDTLKADALEKTDGLAKIYAVTDYTPRPGAQKVLLIINGTPFYDQDRGDAGMSYGVRSIVKELHDNDFITFVAGAPLRSLLAHNLQNTDDGSLSHAVEGGYLGSFSTDLVRMVDWLRTRDVNHFKLYYTSGLMPEAASGADVDLTLYGEKVDLLTYPAISATPPVYKYLTAPSVMLGDPIPVQIEVDPKGKMVSEVELQYQNKDSGFQNYQLLTLNRQKSTPTALLYEGEIPEGDYPEEEMNYLARVYTPFDQMGGDATTTVTVDSVDEGITLTPTLQIENGKKSVKWTLSGTTVDMGSKYELWEAGDDPKSGDLPLGESEKREFVVVITGECDLYQIVKARVWVREGQPHPNNGTWSLFSYPGEYYYEEPGVSQDSVTEEFGVRKMVHCLRETAYEAPASFTSGESGYRPAAKLTLNKTLYYLTAILNPSLKNINLDPERYGLLYLFMDAINQKDYDEYSPDTVNLPVKLLYKAITAANQMGSLKAEFDGALEKLLERLLGNTSI